MTPKPALAAVPAPWTPLEAAVGEGAATVSVAGRTCRLGGHAALPEAIHAGGRDILAGPIRLTAVMAGRPVEWGVPHLSLLSKNAREAVFCGAMQTEGVLVSVSLKASYDGLLRYDLALTPWLSNFRKGAEKAADLEKVWLEIPLKPECASLYTYWPLDTGGVVSVMQPVNSGALPEAGLTLPFKPMLWLGWEEGGLSWFAESDRGWQPASDDRAIEVVREPGRTVLRLRLLDSQPLGWRGNADSWYKPNAPVTFSFGLQATPVKPMARVLAANRIVHLNYYEPLDHMRIESHPSGVKPGESVLDRAAAAGATAVVLHEAWNAVQNYWVSEQPDALKATIQACHARGLKVMPYLGYELSTLAPEWAECHERVLIRNSDGRFRGGWQRLPPQRDYMVCYHSEWQERWLAGVEWMLDEYGFDGVYLDGTTMPSSCANGVHGCGYDKPDGTRAETWPVFAVRRLMERLYGIASARGAMVTAHQSSCCLTPTLQYCHTYWDGEHIGGAFKPGPDGAFPLAVFRAEFMGHNFGIPAEFLSHSPASLSFTLLHDVPIRPGRGELLDAMAPVWKACQAFGTDQAEWLPYWRNAAVVRPETPHTFVSAYRRPGRMLLVVSNLAAAGGDRVALTLPGGCTAARDALGGASLEAKDGRLELACGPMGFRLVEVELPTA